MVIKKNMQNQNKFVGNSQSFAPPPSATVHVLQYSSFWNHKAKSYGIKTTSYAHKTEGCPILKQAYRRLVW